MNLVSLTPENAIKTISNIFTYKGLVCIGTDK